MMCPRFIRDTTVMVPGWGSQEGTEGYLLLVRPRRGGYIRVRTKLYHQGLTEGPNYLTVSTGRNVGVSANALYASRPPQAHLMITRNSDAL